MDWLDVERLKGRAPKNSAPAFLLVVGTTLLGFLLDYQRVYLGGFILGLFFQFNIVAFEEQRTKRVWWLLVTSCSIACHSRWLGMLASVLSQKEQKLLSEWMDHHVERIMCYLSQVVEDLGLRYCHPWFGANAGIFDHLGIGNIYEMLEGLKWELRNDLTFVRELGISDWPIPISERPTTPAYKIEEEMSRLVDKCRGMVTVCLVAIGVYLFGIVGIAFSAVHFLFSVGTMDQPEDMIVPAVGSVKIKNGIYKVDRCIFDIPISRGIATVHNNVIHVPYHVCYGKNLFLEKSVFRPYFVSVSKDLVTYGGPPQMREVRATDKIYVNCETEESRTSYEVEYSVDQDGSIISWAGVTKPGESGSPVLAVDPSEKMELVGLAGRFIQENANSRTEFTHTMPDIKDTRTFRQIVDHPGSGKTRRRIPGEIERIMRNNANKIVIVTGPTRVVCNEIYGSIRGLTPVGLSIKGNCHSTNSTALVQIAAHATVLKMLTKGIFPMELKRVGGIIIDEAHFSDKSTKMLRMMAKYLNETRGIEVVEMSATLDGKTDDRSNHPIADIKIDEKEASDKIAELLEDNKRVLVFVHGFGGRDVRELMKRFDDYIPVKMSRRTFSEAFNQVQDTSKRLIFSTDIAECGINIPDLDAVVDLGKNYKYVYEGGVISGRILNLSEASRVQRRGRVGRTKPGTYYFCREPTAWSYKVDAEIDAEIGSTGRIWNPGGTNDLKLMLSDKQFEKWLDSEEASPLMVYLTTDTNGQQRNPSAYQQAKDKWKEGNVEYIGCKKSTCNLCQGKYQWFDERLHDRLFAKTIEFIET